MKKEIRYPTAEWLDGWMNKHKGKSKEDAEMAWWDKEIDADRPTPFDLDEEHEQAAKKIVRKPANYSLEGKPKRERRKLLNNASLRMGDSASVRYDVASTYQWARRLSDDRLP